MARKTEAEIQAQIARLPKDGRNYVRQLEKELESKDGYIEAMHNGMAGEPEDGAEYWFFTDNIRSVPHGENVSRERHWLPTYVDVGIRLANGDEFEVVRSHFDPNVLEVRLGTETRGRIAVVSTNSHGTMHFQRIESER